MIVTFCASRRRLTDPSNIRIIYLFQRDRNNLIRYLVWILGFYGEISQVVVAIRGQQKGFHWSKLSQNLQPHSHLMSTCCPTLSLSRRLSFYIKKLFILDSTNVSEFWKPSSDSLSGHQAFNPTFRRCGDEHRILTLSTT